MLDMLYATSIDMSSTMLSIITEDKFCSITPDNSLTTLDDTFSMTIDVNDSEMPLDMSCAIMLDIVFETSTDIRSDTLKDMSSIISDAINDDMVFDTSDEIFCETSMMTLDDIIYAAS